MSGELIKGISVQVSAKGMVRGLILTSSALLLAACGGGGGGGEGGIPGGPIAVDPVTISVTADRVALPLNIENEGMSSCLDTPRVGSRYMTTLYVQATTKAGKVLTGEDLFRFNVLSGFESGRLYYLDGNEEHEADCIYIDANGEEKTVQVPAAFRFGTLDAAGNGSTMHLLSTDHAGTVLVEFSVVEPVSNKLVKQTIAVQIGGDRTGRPAQIRVNKVDSNDRQWGFLYPQGLNDPTMLRVQADLVDEAGQAVDNPQVDNLRACLIGGSAAAPGGAYLQSRGEVRFVGALSPNGTCRPENSVTARSINGQAEFSVHSGADIGALVVRIESDRADNNVMNGVALPVYNIVNVPVVTVAPSMFSVYSYAPEEALYQGDAVAFGVPVFGGSAPYACVLDSGSLPRGLELSADCAITGVVAESAALGFYTVRIGVRDSATIANQGVSQVSLEVVAMPVIVTESLPSPRCGVPYGAAVEAMGGKAPLSFSAAGLPLGLSIDSSTGVIDGTVEDADDALVGCQASIPTSIVITVTDANGKVVSKTVRFN